MLCAHTDKDRKRERKKEQTEAQLKPFSLVKPVTLYLLRTCLLIVLEGRKYNLLNCLKQKF